MSNGTVVETVTITAREYEDYLRLQEAAKRHGLTLFDILRRVGTMETA